MPDQTGCAPEQSHAHEAPAHGSVCWTELASKDLDASKKFYTELFGWTLSGGHADGGMNYTEFVAGGRPSGGMYQIVAEMGEMPSHWMSYVAVDDVDASAKKVEELGGKIIRPPMDIPNVGRFCIINDPTGATIALITLGAPPA